MRTGNILLVFVAFILLASVASATDLYYRDSAVVDASSAEYQPKDQIKYVNSSGETVYPNDGGLDYAAYKTLQVRIFLGENTSAPQDYYNVMRLVDLNGNGTADLALRIQKNPTTGHSVWIYCYNYSSGSWYTIISGDNLDPTSVTCNGYPVTAMTMTNADTTANAEVGIDVSGLPTSDWAVSVTSYNATLDTLPPAPFSMWGNSSISAVATLTIPSWCTGSTYSGSGDWDITADTVCQNTNVSMAGSVKVESGAKLTLINTGLLLSSPTGESDLTVRVGGSLETYDSSLVNKSAGTSVSKMFLSGPFKIKDSSVFVDQIYASNLTGFEITGSLLNTTSSQSPFIEMFWVNNGNITNNQIVGAQEVLQIRQEGSNINITGNTFNSTGGASPLGLEVNGYDAMNHKNLSGVIILGNTFISSETSVHVVGYPFGAGGGTNYTDLVNNNNFILQNGTANGMEWEQKWLVDHRVYTADGFMPLPGLQIKHSGDVVGLGPYDFDTSSYTHTSSNVWDNSTAARWRSCYYDGGWIYPCYPEFEDAFVESYMTAYGGHILTENHTFTYSFNDTLEGGYYENTSQEYNITGNMIPGWSPSNITVVFANFTWINMVNFTVPQGDYLFNGLFQEYNASHNYDVNNWWPNAYDYAMGGHGMMALFLNTSLPQHELRYIDFNGDMIPEVKMDVSDVRPGMYCWRYDWENDLYYWYSTSSIRSSLEHCPRYKPIWTNPNGPEILVNAEELWISNSSDMRRTYHLTTSTSRNQTAFTATQKTVTLDGVISPNEYSSSDNYDTQDFWSNYYDYAVGDPDAPSNITIAYGNATYSEIASSEGDVRYVDLDQDYSPEIVLVADLNDGPAPLCWNQSSNLWKLLGGIDTCHGVGVRFSGHSTGTNAQFEAEFNDSTVYVSRDTGMKEVYALSVATDTQAPKVSQVYPTTGTHGETVPFRVNVTDDQGVTGCTFYWKGASVGPMALVSGNSTNGTWEYNYTLIDVYQSYYAWANCTDGAGNWNYTNTSITVLCPAQQVNHTVSKVTNDTVTFEITIGSATKNFTVIIGSNQCAFGSGFSPGTIYQSCINLDPDTSYTYNITLCNDCGNCNSSTGTFKTALAYVNQTVSANETLNITGEIMANFTNAGTSSIAKYSSNPWGIPLPAIGVKYFDVSNQGGGGALVTIKYTDAEVSAAGVDESTLRVYHWNGSAWEDVTVPGSLDTANNQIQGNVTTLSPILLGGSGAAAGAVSTVVSAPGYDVLMVAFLFALAIVFVCCGRSNKTL